MAAQRANANTAHAAIEAGGQQALDAAGVAPMLVVRGLRKVYPARDRMPPMTAVRDLYMTVRRGECLAFLGCVGGGARVLPVVASQGTA